MRIYLLYQLHLQLTLSRLQPVTMAHVSLEATTE